MEVGIMDSININTNISIFINITVITSDLCAAVLSERPECGIIKPVCSDLYLAVGIPAVFVTEHIPISTRLLNTFIPKIYYHAKFQALLGFDYR